MRPECSAQSTQVRFQGGNEPDQFAELERKHGGKDVLWAARLQWTFCSAVKSFDMFWTSLATGQFHGCCLHGWPVGFPKGRHRANMLMTKDRSQMVIQQAARAGCVQQTILCHQIRSFCVLSRTKDRIGHKRKQNSLSFMRHLRNCSSRASKSTYW